MKVKFKRPDTDSYVWVEMAIPKVPRMNNLLDCFHLENMHTSKGPGDDWYPVEYERKEQ